MVAKRQRPEDGDAAVDTSGDRNYGGRPHKNGKTASRQPHAATQQPETAARSLQAADIRAPGMSSISSFAQLQVRSLSVFSSFCMR